MEGGELTFFLWERGWGGGWRVDVLSVGGGELTFFLLGWGWGGGVES